MVRVGFCESNVLSKRASASASKGSWHRASQVPLLAHGRPFDSRRHWCLRLLMPGQQACERAWLVMGPCESNVLSKQASASASKGRNVSGGSVQFVYILRCADGSYYVGRTTHLSSRVKAHNLGEGPKCTAARRPVRLAYSEQHLTLEEAITRERQLKRWTRAKKESLIRGDPVELKRLSKRRR